MSTARCDFVFQHCHGKKWILYSDEELEILNKAFRREQKKVTLPSKDPKKRIVVDFVKMVQTNQVSKMTKKIRALIFTEDRSFYAWMFDENNEDYCSFKPFQMFFLEVAFQQKLKKVKFHYEVDFTVDIKNMNLIDEECNESMPVIREKVNLNHSNVIEEIIYQNGKLMEEYCGVAIRACEKRIYDSHLFPSKLLLNSPNKCVDSDSFLSAQEFQNLESHTNTCSSVHKDCPNAKEYNVYSAGKLYYSVALSHTSIEDNINKHLFMQILVDKKNKYFLYDSCGRIGLKATTTLKPFEGKLNEAVHEFEEKFYEKTKNEWRDIKTFRKFYGKYDLLQMDMSSEVVQQNSSAESCLGEEVKELISLITSRKIMNQIMEEWKYDFQSVPLGKLALAQIKEGYSALNKIAKKISDDGKGKDLVESCDEFYTKIPHDFGRKKPLVIQTQEQVKEKLRMLEALLNINIAVDIFNEIPSVFKHPLDQCYEYLGWEITPLKENKHEFKILKEYFTETHGPTHNYKMKIERIFSCNKNEPSFDNIEKKYLLWHGSRITNWAGILKGGLQIAPQEAPSTGAMFGKGLYFADVSSKSANYCYPTKTLDRGLLVLCEVSLGNTLELLHAAENMPENLPPNFDSITGVGKFVPSKFECIKSISTSFQVPRGPLQTKSDVFTSLDYNEYVVYSPLQVKMKYLVLVKFEFD